MFDKVVQGVELSVLVGFQPVLAAPSKQRSERLIHFGESAAML
jgi:hypothetical protein